MGRNRASRTSPRPSPLRGEGNGSPEVVEVGRRRGLEGHLLVGPWMPQAEPPGVKHRPRRLARPASAVLGITGQRVTERREMNADLMRASGLEVTAQECMRAAPLDDLISGARKPAAGDDRHSLAILRVTADGAFELTRIRLEAAASDRQVCAAQRAVAELRRKGAMAGIVARH